VNVPKIHPHTQIVRSVIEGIGVAVDIGMAPAAATLIAGYALVWPRDVVLDGPVSDEHADAYPEVQVTAVSATADGAATIADRILAALLSTDPAPPEGREWLNPGQAVQFVSALGAQRDDAVDPPAFSVPIVVRLPSTPVTTPA
jgi:hypothetical protein